MSLLANQYKASFTRAFISACWSSKRACWSTKKSNFGKDTDSERSLIFLLSARFKAQFYSFAHLAGSEEIRAVKIASV